MAARTLNIVGCGRVGMTLGRLLSAGGLCTIGSVVNRSLESATRAISFIGSGHAVSSIAEISPADLVFIGTSDSFIPDCVYALVSEKRVQAGGVVFHCSGALSSDVLAAVSALSAVTASVHPVKSFADPAAAAATFSGTPCVVEGDKNALEILEPLFSAMGARLIRVRPRDKLLYHAGTVFGSNFVVLLLHGAHKILVEAGMSGEDSLQLLEPLVKGSIQNFFSFGAEKALTGPVARGEVALVEDQYAVLKGNDATLADIYRSISLLALQIAKLSPGAPLEELSELEQSLASK